MFKCNSARQTGGYGCGGAPAQVGGFSDYMSSFYASGAVGGPGAISRFTLSGINNAPMFNPLSTTAVIPTLPSTGIVPSEAYLANMQGGAAKRRPVSRASGNNAISLDRLRAKCNKAGLSCRYKNGKYLPRDTLVKLLKSNQVN
jgi:hypothetical protein